MYTIYQVINEGCCQDINGGCGTAKIEICSRFVAHG